MHIAVGTLMNESDLICEKCGATADVHVCAVAERGLGVQSSTRRSLCRSCAEAEGMDLRPTEISPGELESLRQMPDILHSMPFTDARFTTRVLAIMALANQEAMREEPAPIAGEHILLGMLTVGTGIGVTALAKMGVDMDTLRAELQDVLRKNPSKTRKPNFQKTLIVGRRSRDQQWSSM